MRARPLTGLQQRALLQLHVRWRWGIDCRTSRGLLTRGLIALRPHTFADVTFGRSVTVQLPWLTTEGAREAARLWLELPVERKRAVRAELVSFGL